MKRSRSIVLTTIMTSTGLSLAACDASPPTSSTWLNPPPAAEASAAQSVGGRTYPTLQACRDADVVPNSECDSAFNQAQAQAPRFTDRQSCEQRYGVDQCVPRNQAGGGSFFMPLLTGFVVGQALNNLGGRGYYGMQNPGRYDDRLGGGGYYGGGYRGGRDYVTGRSPGGYDAPARVQSRSSVISRGGFGGGGGGGFGG